MSASGVTDRPEPANGLRHSVRLSGTNVPRLTVIALIGLARIGRIDAVSRTLG